jgi:MbtH protein
MADIDDKVDYIVVLNGEEQYSILLSESEVPAGWFVEGFHGSRQECLDHIDLVWTDMRPLSVRRRMDGN